MKTIYYLMLLFGFGIAATTRGEIVAISGGVIHSGIPDSFTTTTPAIIGSFTNGFSASLDTVADVGTITGVEFRLQLYGGTGERSRVITIGDFPNVTTTVVRLKETISFDPIVMPPPRFVSSTTEPIFFAGGHLFYFSPTVNVEFPESFTVSGIHKLEGPTQTVTTPFNVLFERIGSASESIPTRVSINVGNNFPLTTKMRSEGGTRRRDYRPIGTEIFNGTVDGFDIRAAFSTMTVYAGMGFRVPEPTGAGLLGAGLVCALSSCQFLRVHGVSSRR